MPRRRKLGLATSSALPHVLPIGAFVAVLAAVAALPMLSLTPLTAAMAVHVLLMNAFAPVLALRIAGTSSLAPRLRSGSLLWLATLLQLIALWSAHLPGFRSSSHTAAQLCLFIAALFFWLAVLAQKEDARWRALFALLITAKLYCLLGVLLVLSPRLLYGYALHHGAQDLADQQLAGLVMLAACPLTYIGAATVIAARWLGVSASPCRATARRVS